MQGLQVMPKQILFTHRIIQHRTVKGCVKLCLICSIKSMLTPENKCKNSHRPLHESKYFVTCFLYSHHICRPPEAPACRCPLAALCPSGKSSSSVTQGSAPPSVTASSASCWAELRRWAQAPHHAFLLDSKHQCPSGLSTQSSPVLPVHTWLPAYPQPPHHQRVCRQHGRYCPRPPVTKSWPTEVKSPS